MFFYQCYGVTIASQIPLPSLLTIKEQSTDVVFMLVDEITFDKESAEFVNGFWINSSKEVYFETDFGAFLGSEGKLLKMKIDDPAFTTEASQYAMGSGMGILLIQQQKLVLHASVVEKEGEAILFLGKSGAGKSTTAWNFLQNGYKLVSDDLAVISFKDGEPFVEIGYPRNKISEDVVLAYEGKLDQNEEPFDEGRLKYYRYPNRFSIHKPAVRWLFVLNQKKIDAPAFSEKKGVHLFHAMYRNSYRFQLIKRLDFAENHLTQSMALFQKIRTKSVLFPVGKLDIKSTFELFNNFLAL